MRKGIFITLEGCDGCGKSTQAPRLADFLSSFERSMVHTREPGGTPFAEQLRKIILNPDLEITPVAELMLYEAARSQHLVSTIVPALNKGFLVLCERYIDATVAYQGYGRKLSLKMIQQLNALATGNLMPDLTLVLDLPVEQGLERARVRCQLPDRMEQQDLAFHRRVRAGYKAIARQFPKRVRLVSGIGTIDEVQRRLQKECQKILKLH